MAEAKEKHGFLRSARDMKGEMKKVVWPSKKQVLNNTGVVIIFMILMAIVVGALDFGMAAILKVIFGG